MSHSVTEDARRGLRTLLTSPLLWYGAAGLVMGEVVAAMAGQRGASVWTLVCAMVFLLAGATGTILMLVVMNSQRRRHPAGVPVKSWLWVMSAGVLAAVYI